MKLHLLSQQHQTQAWQHGNYITSLFYKIEMFRPIFFVPGIIPSFHNIILVLNPPSPPFYTPKLNETNVCIEEHFGAIIQINDKLHNKIFTWSGQVCCSIWNHLVQKAKGKNETQFPDPTAPKFSYSNCYNRVRVSQKTPTAFLQQLQCTDFATDPILAWVW